MEELTTDFDVVLYPNPALDNVTIQVGFSGELNLVIRDVSGKIVMRKTGITVRPLMSI